jgi:hypothetical protein
MVYPHLSYWNSHIIPNNAIGNHHSSPFITINHH